MRIAFGLSSITASRHESHAELAAFLSEAQNVLWIGEAAEAYASFWSAELHEEYGSVIARIGIIVERHNAVPQFAIGPDGSLFAIGFNRCVAFIQGPPLHAQENMLNASFFNFIAKDEVLVAIHELGCTAFSSSTCDRKWEIDTDIVECASLEGHWLSLKTSDGVIHRIDLFTGEDEESKKEKGPS